MRMRFNNEVLQKSALLRSANILRKVLKTFIRKNQLLIKSNVYLSYVQFQQESN